MTSRQKLLALIFSSDGLLSRSLKNFEERRGQKEMADRILSAYDEDGVALIEAGTGTGKSLAYLYPAVYWALKNQEKTVITTHTIALQEQLLHKDIPFLLKVMDLDLKACLVKGMGNYLCLRKLKELEDQPLLFQMEETKEVLQIQKWAEKTTEGSRSEIPFAVSPGTWEKVTAEAESCTRTQCPHYEECFFFKARRKAADSQLLVVNHHLLLADLQKRRRNPGQESILPLYHRLVIDEAHHLEDIALESFAERFDRTVFLRQLARIHSDAHPERSRIPLLKAQLATLPNLPPSLIQKFEIDIPAQKRVCQTVLEESFATLIHFFETVAASKQNESKRRITASITEHPFWKRTVVQALSGLAQEIHHLVLLLNGIGSDLEEHKGSPGYGKLAPHLLEIQATSQRLDLSGQFLDQFIRDLPQKKRVRWVETFGVNVCLVDASLDVSQILNEHLFGALRTSVLCSATMATAKSFSFLKKRLGLDLHQGRLLEEIFESPFDYQERSLLAVPTDLAAPSSPDFLAECIQAMAEIIGISRGSVFLLFTSYEMLQNCWRSLSCGPMAQQFPFLRQGDLPRHQLLEQFKKREGSVLFATDSFWEGVDVPGEALRCVVIVKLPFAVPGDPLYEAWAESLQKQGLDPFSDYSVPQAVIKFKQGFGRLMRKKDDRGCVVCLDHRLVTKNYGKQFLGSLPSSATCFAPKGEVYARMRQFYERTKVKEPVPPLHR